jgi:hypothetical protein
MCSDLLQEVEHLSAAKVGWRNPFLRSGVAEEDSCEEVEMNAVSAETMPTLVLRELYGQIRIPESLPQLESVHCRAEQLLGSFVDSTGRSSRALRCTCTTNRDSTEQLPLGVVDLNMDGVDED